MDKMLNYIFGSLGTSEEAVKRINRRLGKQSAINMWLLSLYIWGLAYSYGVNLKFRTQEIKLQELEERLKFLESENEKG